MVLYVNKFKQNYCIKFVDCFTWWRWLHRTWIGSKFWLPEKPPLGAPPPRPGGEKGPPRPRPPRCAGDGHLLWLAMDRESSSKLWFWLPNWQAESNWSEINYQQICKKLKQTINSKIGGWSVTFGIAHSRAFNKVLELEMRLVERESLAFCCFDFVVVTGSQIFLKIVISVVRFFPRKLYRWELNLNRNNYLALTSRFFHSSQALLLLLHFSTNESFLYFEVMVISSLISKITCSSPIPTCISCSRRFFLSADSTFTISIWERSSSSSAFHLFPKSISKVSCAANRGGYEYSSSKP